MPEVFRESGFVFFFYTNESQEPMHIHVRKASGFAKFRIEPVELEFAQDYIGPTRTRTYPSPELLKAGSDKCNF